MNLTEAPSIQTVKVKNTKSVFFLCPTKPLIVETLSIDFTAQGKKKSPAGVNQFRISWKHVGHSPVLTITHW